jgi:hypothetical protein
MKRIFYLLTVCLLGSNLTLRAEDASAIADRQAGEERYQKLVAKLEELSEKYDLQQKRMAQLEADLKAVRDEQSKPNTDVVGRDELKQLALQVKEIDKNRASDKEQILDQIKQLAQVPAVPATPTPKKTKVKKPVVETPTDTTTDAGGDKNYEGYEYVIKPNDTISKIVAAYREQGVKVTSAQILKHPLNAKVDPAKLKVGQKVFIPAPAK